MVIFDILKHVWTIFAFLAFLAICEKLHLVTLGAVQVLSTYCIPDGSQWCLLEEVAVAVKIGFQYKDGKVPLSGSCPID